MTMKIVLTCTESKGWFFDLPCTLENQTGEHCKLQVSTRILQVLKRLILLVLYKRSRSWQTKL